MMAVGMLMTGSIVRSIVLEASPTCHSAVSSSLLSIFRLLTSTGVDGVWEEGASGYLVPSVEYDDNGLLNMQEIKEFDSWETRFPACKWCDDYGRDWYLPAINELSDIYSQKSVLNSVLSAHGFTELASDRYWSSTRCNQYNLYCISFTTGEFASPSYSSSNYRSASYYIRAVISIW